MLDFNKNQQRIFKRGYSRVLNQVEFEIHIRDMRTYMKGFDGLFFQWAARLQTTELTVSVDNYTDKILQQAKIQMHLLMQGYRPGQAFRVLHSYNDVIGNMENDAKVRKEVLNSIKFQNMHVSTI